MPYFYIENSLNLLFIHIPKTGGTSVKNYLSHIYKIPLDNSSLEYKIENNIDNNIDNNLNISLQHMTYKNIMKYKNFFKINTNNLEIITIVRNPYERIMSDLFFFNKINKDSSKEEVNDAIKIYFSENLDNHTIPQYEFLLDEKNKILKNIKILHIETLKNDMINIGYSDFDIFINTNSIKINYYDYLNNDSINIINQYYYYDFIIFNYDMINR